MTGEVVVVLFPFSDMSSAKNRPALVLIDVSGPDVVLAAITSTANNPHAVALDTTDFQIGRLDHPSFVHPTKLFMCERSQIKKVVGKIKEHKRAEVDAALVNLLK
jgi:mRNA interferase MazF